MGRITKDYLLGKLCGNPKEFDYEATKQHFYDYADDDEDNNGFCKNYIGSVFFVPKGESKE